MASSPRRGYKGSWIPRRSQRLAGADGKLDAAEVRKALDAEVPESRRRAEPQGRRPRRPADHLVRHDRRDPRPGGREAGGLDRQELQAGPAAPRHGRLHGQQPPEHPRRDDGQRRRRLLRHARGPLPQRRHRPHRLQPPHGRLPEGDRRRGRAHRRRGPPRRAEDGQPDLQGPLGPAGAWRRPSSRRPTPTPATPRRASPP